MHTRTGPDEPPGATHRLAAAANSGAANMRLTELAPGAGCGCKLSASELAAVFAAVSQEAPTDARLIVGPERSDDAGVFDLGDGRTMVQSVDVFTPVVDDAFDWGRVAAANALSDIYSMGARPVTALKILCWPRALG
ncbi:MAG: selenide, water dikinase SelD, partial [Microthrixaceae bacterium]